MKKIFILLAVFPLFIFCNSNDDVVVENEEVQVSLLGTWLYIAGRDNNDAPPIPPDELPFIEYYSENTVTFNADSTIVSNSASLCFNTHIKYPNGTQGVYTLVDSTYNSNDCLPYPNYRYHFTQTDSILIISYPYNGISEGKFKKIADIE